MSQDVEFKQHLRVEAFSDSEDFRSRKPGRSADVPLRDRNFHGNSLGRKYQEILDQTKDKSPLADSSITDEIGIYVELVSFENTELPLASLDTRDFELRSCRKVNRKEVAIVFIPDSRRAAFQSKISQYLSPEKDGKNGPRNHNLIDSIEDIRLAEIRSFWTDLPALFPEDVNRQVWWELWLKRLPDVASPVQLTSELAQRLDLRVGNSYQVFFDSTVTLIYASVRQLEGATELISTLEELRAVSLTPNFFIETSAKEQIDWARNLELRLNPMDDINSSVVILDNGINYNHPLLSHFTKAELSERWNPLWPPYNDYSVVRYPGWDHGSRQAGIVGFGDLADSLVSREQINITYLIESGRILPATGQNDPDLYGAITTGVASKLEIERPGWRRVYSLAVTSDGDRSGGQPTSWSAQIDLFSSGITDGTRRLFVISTGNNRDLGLEPDYWDQIQLAQIEDPAQSWNALTVGAYTEKSTNDDPAYDGWGPLAPPGDISPIARSSVNWRWRKQAPFKPDLVAEGGNRLISPDHTEITDEDVVSLLTTSGRSAGQIFDVTGDTSAACALVSRYAAILTSEHQDYWPEIIRGLLIHSAEWTDAMWSRFGLLCDVHSLKIAKETMLRCVGYGVPNLQRARYSANHALTLIAQGELQPFIKKDENSSENPTLNEMFLYELPWPIEDLRQLDPKLEVKLRVTLSYFVEPNPGRRGYRQRFSYQSHGLRFEVIRPGQSLDNFKASINAFANDPESYDGVEGMSDGWRLGSQLRVRGSLHSDTWIGTAQNLADMHTIAVYPVGGWWKYRKAEERWRNKVRYSLIVSIDVPDSEVNIYTSVANQIQTEIEIE